MTTLDHVLTDIYYNIYSPGAFANARQLYAVAKRKNQKITQNYVKTWLSTQSNHSINRTRRKRFLRRPYITKGINYLHQMDLLDMTRLSAYNSNYRYLLTIIDCFSRYAFVRPVKRKTSLQVAQAIKAVYTDNPSRLPTYAQSDFGGEFVGPEVQALLKQMNISWYHVPGIIKGSYVERFNRTFRRIISKAVFGMGRARYLSILQDLVSLYNRRNHRAIGMAPQDVSEENEAALWARLYGDTVSYKAVFKFKIGDIVKILRKKGIFDKEAVPTWSKENYEVLYCRATKPPTYKIYDPRSQSVVRKSYYQQELQKIWHKK